MPDVIVGTSKQPYIGSVSPKMPKPKGVLPNGVIQSVHSMRICMETDTKLTPAGTSARTRMTAATTLLLHSTYARIAENARNVDAS